MISSTILARTSEKPLGHGIEERLRSECTVNRLMGSDELSDDTPNSFDLQKSYYYDNLDELR